MRRYLSVLFCCPLIALAAEPTPGDITSCMRANIPQTVRIQQVEITSWDRDQGERRLKGKLFGTREKERARVMMRIEAPSDLAGAAFLVRETEKSDETFLYLPAVQKVRRITGGQMDGQLW